MTPLPTRFVMPALVAISWFVLLAVVLVIPAHWPVLAVWLGLLLLGGAIGSARPTLDFFGRSYSRQPSATDRIALTFDDGPDPEHTLDIAQALEDAGGRGTFFVVGERVERHPDIVRELVARGHQVGLHGHAHRWLVMLREPRLIEDLLAADRAVASAVGKHPRWFRPPIGLTAPPLMNVLRQWRLFFAGWSVRPFDGRVDDPEEVRRRVGAEARPGDVILMHDAHPVHAPPRTPPAAAAIRGILEDLAQRGLRPVTMAEMFDEPAWFEEGEVSEEGRRAYRRGRLQLSVWATVAALSVALVLFGTGVARAGDGAPLPPELLQAAAALGQHDTVRSSFEQTKSSVLFAEDMVRTGTLEMRRRDGRLLWTYADGPSFLMADGRFFPAGKTTDEAGSDGAQGFSMPGGADFTGLLEALFTLDPKAIARHFDAKTLPDGRFELVPKEVGARGLFSKVILEVGGDPITLRSTTMEEGTGDTTVLRFLHTEPGASIPAERFQTPAERTAAGE